MMLPQITTANRILTLLTNDQLNLNTFPKDVRFFLQHSHTHERVRILFSEHFKLHVKIIGQNIELNCDFPTLRNIQFSTWTQR